jgi:hypothetical protein
MHEGHEPDALAHLADALSRVTVLDRWRVSANRLVRGTGAALAGLDAEQGLENRAMYRLVASTRMGVATLGRGGTSEIGRLPFSTGLIATPEDWRTAMKLKRRT